MRVAIDAMGGDFAPDEIVLGALQALKEYKCEIVLVGDEPKIVQALDKYGEWKNSGISVCHASEVIEMYEHPGVAVRKKKDASIVVSARLVKEGKCDVAISAGNTGGF
jgi:glycerol-3-phosphate acyltransferase PlsX